MEHVWNGSECGPLQPTLPGVFCLRVAEAGRQVLGRVQGPLNGYHAMELLERLSVLANEGRRVVLDLRQVDFMDSAGVRALLRVQEAFEAAEGELRLVIQPDSRVERTLRLLQLGERFQVFTSASAAWIQRSVN